MEQAAALHPLTRLPGSDMLAELVDRKAADGDAFAVSWLDVDDFGAVSAGDGMGYGGLKISNVATRESTDQKSPGLAKKPLPLADGDGGLMVPSDSRLSGHGKRSTSSGCICNRCSTAPCVSLNFDFRMTAPCREQSTEKL